MGGDGVDDFITQASRRIGFGQCDKFRDVAGTAFRDNRAEAGFEEIAFFFAEVNAACFGDIAGEQGELTGIFREIEHVSLGFSRSLESEEPVDARGDFLKGENLVLQIPLDDSLWHPVDGRGGGVLCDAPTRAGQLQTRNAIGSITTHAG